MKCCEFCGGLGHDASVICSACSGTGLICLGHESAARYAHLKREARIKAARLGWQEVVWSDRPCGCVRKVKRAITVDADQELVPMMNEVRR